MIKEPLPVPMLWVLIFQYNYIKEYNIKYNLQNAPQYNWSGQHGEVEWHGVFSRGWSSSITVWSIIITKIPFQFNLDILFKESRNNPSHSHQVSI